MLSIIIPSCKDKILQKTIDDVRKNATGEYEIIVVLDGYPQDVTGADIVIQKPERKGLRAAVNSGVAASSGDILMKTDSHCSFGKGFDEIITRDIKDNQIVIPRRYKLNIDTWELYDEPPIDYEKLIVTEPDRICGVHWKQRAEAKKDIMIDETMVFQGSCYFMKRTHWERLGGLSEYGYGEFTQEPIELALKTWLGGGRVLVNKNTWYAHKHRDFKRVVSPRGVAEGNLYSKDYWLNNRWEDRKHDLKWLFDRFELKYRPNA